MVQENVQDAACVDRGDPGMAQGIEQDEARRAAFGLLVVTHEGEQLDRGERRQAHRQAGTPDQRRHAARRRPRRSARGRCERSAASTMPQPTASPCSQVP